MREGRGQAQGVTKTWATGLEEQRRIIESVSISARDKATIQKLFTRMENHYYALIRVRDVQIAKLTDSQADMSTKLGVLEKVSVAAEMRHAVDIQAAEQSLAAQASELRAARAALEAAKGRSDTKGEVDQTAVMALGVELCLAENMEVELRQVLGFMRQTSQIKDKRIEALESQKREVLTMNDQMRAALAAQEKRATRNGERAARLEAQDARNKATIASLHRDMAKVAKENAELRTSLEREISESIAMRQEVVMLRQQVQVQANQAKAKVEGYASQYKAEAVQARARLLQMEKAFERAMAREDVIVRTGGGFVPLPRLLERYMSLAAAGDEGAVGSLDANSLLADLLPSPGPHVGPPGAAGAPAPAASFADRPQPARGGVSGGGRVRAAGPSAPVPNATAPQPVR